MNLFDRYKIHERRYEVFNLPKNELKSLVRPLEWRNNGFDEWIGLKWSGSFFAYNKPVCWIYISNHHAGTKKWRHAERGFYITITTIDDDALYGSWDEPLSALKCDAVVSYFNKLKSLRSYKEMCSNLNSIIAINGMIDNS